MGMWRVGGPLLRWAVGGVSVSMTSLLCISALGRGEASTSKARVAAVKIANTHAHTHGLLLKLLDAHKQFC